MYPDYVINMEYLTAGLIQQANTSDKESNKNKLIENIRICADKGAQLIVLPELHNSLYFCQTENTQVFDGAETIPGPSTELFGNLAKELGVVLVLSLFEKRTPGLYHNTAVVIEKDGTIAGKYRKELENVPGISFLHDIDRKSTRLNSSH